ncbi:MAG: phage capsid protein [Bacteroidales bacterium]|nr:phage capsid protein [Bacteroidales bacterium]
MNLPNTISNIPREVFVTYIVEKLRKENPHLLACFDESNFVMGGAVVHVPNAGASPDTQKNRSSFPAVAVMRGDSHVTYALDVYSTDPTHITWHEGAEISYDKTDSVLNDHMQTLIEAVGDNMLYNWVVGLHLSGGSYVTDTIPSTNVIFTTGDWTAVNPDDGQEGVRRSLLYAELQKAQAMMNKAGVPKTNRFAMIESYMHQQLIESLSANQMAAYQKAADLAKGIVGEFAGFKIMERGSVLAFNEAGSTPIVPGVAIDDSDNIACLCWQKDQVTKAQGDIMPFDDKGNPLYYGDVFSSLVKFGGRVRRADWKGIIAIVQTSVDTTELDALIVTAEALVEITYTTATWATFAAALAAALAVAENAAHTTATVADAVVSLQAAIDQLVEA